MLNRIKSKLKSNKGVSILLVLVLFLLCVMISSIITVAASSGASRTKKRTEQQQGYFAVISAAELIIAEMEDAGEFVGLEQNLDYGCNITGDFQYVSDASRFDEQFVDELESIPSEGEPEESPEEGEPEGTPEEGEPEATPIDEEGEGEPEATPEEDEAEESPEEGEPEESPEEEATPAPVFEPLHSDITKDSEEDIWQVDLEKTELKGSFKNLLLEACTKLYDEQEESYEETFTMTSDDSRIPDVNGTFIMNKDYYITVILKAVDSSYAVTITFNPTMAIEEEAKDISCNHYIKYREILPDGSIKVEYTTAELIGIKGEHKNIRTKIAWSLHEFTKGVGVYVPEEAEE